MSHKSPAIAERIAHLQGHKQPAHLQGHKQPAHLLGWLECCFNQRLTMIDTTLFSNYQGVHEIRVYYNGFACGFDFGS
jgi:hypothetical protein